MLRKGRSIKICTNEYVKWIADFERVKELNRTNKRTK